MQVQSDSCAKSLRTGRCDTKPKRHHGAIRQRTRDLIARSIVSCIGLLSPLTYGQSDREPTQAAIVPSTQAPVPLRSAPQRTWTQALLFDVTAGFVPYANDVPLMVGMGVRIAGIHEVWARAGYIPTGDDTGYAFGCGGYRAALRPHKIVRPIFGALFAGLPATCGHDDMGRPQCTPEPLFILAGTAGVRFEPVPWLGVFSVLTLGADSYPNPFGMIELGASFALPLQ